MGGFGMPHLRPSLAELSASSRKITCCFKTTWLWKLPACYCICLSPNMHKCSSVAVFISVQSYGCLMCICVQCIGNSCGMLISVVILYCWFLFQTNSGSGKMIGWGGIVDFFLWLFFSFFLACFKLCYNLLFNLFHFFLFLYLFIYLSLFHFSVFCLIFFSFFHEQHWS